MRPRELRRGLSLQDKDRAKRVKEDAVKLLKNPGALQSAKDEELAMLVGMIELELESRGGGVLGPGMTWTKRLANDA